MCRFVTVATLLTGALLRILANEAHVSVQVFKVGPEFDKIKVARDEQNCVAPTLLCSCVHSLPHFLCEVVEPSGIGMFERAD